jgi:hypothetical protein
VAGFAVVKQLEYFAVKFDLDRKMVWNSND